LELRFNFIPANILVIAAIILLSIYGIDVLLKSMDTDGFLPFNSLERGIIFGGTAVSMLIISFVISKENSLFVSIMLMISGILMILGGSIQVMNPNVGIVNGIFISMITILGISKIMRFRNFSNTDTGKTIAHH